MRSTEAKLSVAIGPKRTGKPAVGAYSPLSIEKFASASEEQSAVAEEINRNIVSISQVTSQTADGSRQTAAASDELAQLAAQLQTLVGQFRL